MKHVIPFFKRKRLILKTVYKIAACISIFGLMGCIGQGTGPVSDEKSSVDDIVAQLEGLPIDEFFEESYKQLQLRDPDTLFINGLADEYGVPNDRFTNISDQYIRETQKLESAILDLLRSYDRSALSSEQQLSYDIYEWYLDDLVQRHEFMYYDYPVNSLTIWGKQNWLIDFMVNYQPINGIEDAENYIARLSQIDTWVEQLLEQLKLREDAGVIPPTYVIEESISQIEQHVQERDDGTFAVQATRLYTSFQEKLEHIEGITDEQEQTLLDSALTEIEETFVPAFIELRDYLVYLESIASDTPGVGTLPKGHAYYTYVLHHQTGTNMSAEEIHELGLAEVGRIQAEIQVIAADLGYPEGISMADLEKRLSMNGDYLKGDALLAEYERLIAEADQAMEEFFDLLPSTELIIQPEPFGSGIGYYLPPPLDGSGPGVFYTTPEYPIMCYIIPTFIFHETVPGHHVQGALARELDLPAFRRELDLNGYSEGWAVYAEKLAWEMGLYKDNPIGNLGRLQFELSRAARLVIDTGIHTKGWTRQEAATYYEEATGKQTSPSSMNRYIILPGQGCGYTIGLLKILELRQKAMDQLGATFDIKEFHNVILGNGPMPMHILEQVVNDWIEAKLSE
jgi:uncharacterized protein (DUF885 family)